MNRVYSSLCKVKMKSDNGVVFPINQDGQYIFNNFNHHQSIFPIFPGNPNIDSSLHSKSMISCTVASIFSGTQ